MKSIFVYIIVFLLSVSAVFSQNRKEQMREIKKFQKELDEEYSSPSTTPLRGENLKNFSGHPFFPVNLKYCVTATLEKIDGARPFEIQTSSGKTKTYQEYGTLHFTLEGQPCTLTVYVSLALLKDPAYRDYLFLPFRDATNGTDTYGGGRYLDLRIPKGKTVTVDFNKAYQPYCAYNAYDYSCPVVPAENTLPIRIEAGMKYWGADDH